MKKATKKPDPLLGFLQAIIDSQQKLIENLEFQNRTLLFLLRRETKNPTILKFFENEPLLNPDQ